MLQQILDAQVPPEAFPTSAPKGKHSYTIWSPNGARLEVHLKGKKFYIAKAACVLADGVSRSVSWSKHASVDIAWAYAKKISCWDSPSSEEVVH